MAKKAAHVAMIGTGGSISTQARHSLDLFEYPDFGHCLEVDELLAMFPEISATFDVVPVRYRATIGPAITPEDWLGLVRCIHEVVENDPAVAGIVVTHGTGSLEETAYFLHLTTKVDVPVVVVGAQRPANGFGTDSGINLFDAVRVAASPAARGLGTLVVLNNEIQSAREVSKTSTHRLQTFRSPDYGILGHADPDGAVAIYRKPARRHGPDTEFDVSGLSHLPIVDIVYSYIGADGRAIKALAESGSKGIVNAGMPSGRPTPAQRQAMVEASHQGTLIVQCSRAGSGRVMTRAKDLEAGFVSADNLNPQKARILAMLALTVTEDRGEIRRMFAEY
jgi:L-asparaginase